MDSNLAKKTREELISLCKEKSIKGYSNKKKDELIKLLEEKKEVKEVKRRALSLFSGAGGDTCGLEEGGWTVTHFSENNDLAIKTHLAAFPSSTLLLGKDNSKDIRNIPDSTFQELHGKIDLIFAGHPCFVKDTLVSTNNGYKVIQDVTLDDKLLTHTGKYQNIVNLQRKVYSGKLYTIKVKYHPESITCTEEHPFYIRHKNKKWNNSLRKYENVFDKPEWKNASSLTLDDYFGLPINTNTNIPSFTFDKIINNNRTDKIHITLDNPDQWFMMGYFIGDGWVEDILKSDGRNSYRIRFAFHNDDSEIIKRIQTILPITDKHCDSGKCKKYGCSDMIWYNILKEFGKYAHLKKIPEWVHDAPKELIQEFINGYMAADGYIRSNKSHRITTTSANLAYGIQRLYLKLGNIVAVDKTKRPSTCIIQGRLCNQRDTYQINFYPTNNSRYSTFIEDNYVWYAPSTITTNEIVNEPVYNFEVENDNSYVVCNIVAHNCQGFSHAGKKKENDPRNELVHEFVRAAKVIQPEWIVGENVKGLLSRKGVYPKNTSPRPVIEIIKELFESIGYKLTYRLIDTVEVGVPQRRKRLLYIGHRGSEYPHLAWDELKMPEKMPSIRSLLSSTLEGAIKLPDLYKPSEQPEKFWIPTEETEAFGTPHPNLVRLANGIRNLSTKEKEAQKRNVKEAIQYIEPEGLLSFGVRKSGYHGQILDPDGPSKTIICAYNQCPRLFVGLHNKTTNTYWIRCLTSTECGEIQGFRNDYPWQGKVKDKITQIGNAVPPPLAKRISELIQKAKFSSTPQITIDKETESDSDDE